MRALMALAFALSVQFYYVEAARGKVADNVRGQEIAEKLCSRCHAVGRGGRSPHAKAPPFRDLAKRYPVEHLAEALAEGIRTGHPDMPEFKLSPPDIGALLTYLREIGAPGRKPVRR